MSIRSILTAALLACSLCAFAEKGDTFSIVAVDPKTGEVGAAGASCVDISLFGMAPSFLAKLHPGKGVIATQSFYDPTNQKNASAKLDEGMSPDDIVQWLENNDAFGDSAERQYGIAALGADNKPKTAAFTGKECLDYKNHITGSNYAIQGNILINGDVLKKMEKGFLETEGSLSEKLMAAMQGANIPGADKRCLDAGVSSLFSFLKVVKSDGSTTVDLGVPKTDEGVDPIDVLQEKFDAWKDE